jgi:hypothetical protein
MGPFDRFFGFLGTVVLGQKSEPILWEPSATGPYTQAILHPFFLWKRASHTTLLSTQVNVWSSPTGMAKSTYKFCACFTKAWNAPNFVKVVCATPIKTIVPKIVKNINKKKQSNIF